MKTVCLRSIALLLLLRIATIVSAQTIETDKKVHVSINLNTLSILDFYYPTIQPGIEARYKSFAIGYKYGPAVNRFVKKEGPTQGELVSYKGQKQKIEARYYHKDKNLPEDELVFIGLEAFTNAFEKERQNGIFYDKGMDYEYRYDYIRQKINVKGLAVKYGRIQPLSKRFLFEYTNSIGVRRYRLSNEEVTNLQAKEYIVRHKGFDYSHKDIVGTRKKIYYAITLTFIYQLL